MKLFRARGKILLIILSILCTLSMTSCQALMEQEEIDPTKTQGEKEYTGFQNIEQEGSDEQVLAAGGIVCNRSKVSKGEANFTTFMDKVNEGSPCAIRIKQKIGEEEAFFRDLSFDGGKYRLVISTDPEQYDYTYDYLYDLTGRRNKYCRKSRIVFLTNTKDATFDDIIGSIGVNDENQKIDYQLVFRNQ